jgi:Mind bomb SH3 repeat domain
LTGVVLYENLKNEAEKSNRMWETVLAFSLSACVLQTAGKTGRVVAVDSDGDVKVEIAGKQWLYNPQCCILESRVQQQADDSDDDDENDDIESDADAVASKKFLQLHE